MIGVFFMLDKLPTVVAGMCMIIGYTILVDRIWPEKWGDSNKNKG